MAARRCGLCGIHYPAEAKFADCPVHGVATVYMSAAVADEHWDWKATEIQTRIGQRLPVVSEPPSERADGLYQIPRARFSRILRDGDVFDVRPAAPPESGHPSESMWEVLFVTGPDYIVRPLRVPDHVPEA